MTGALIAVVGPSGAGKDAVIDEARQHYANDARVVFPQRVITRPAGPGEDHQPVSDEEFDAIERSGGFALSWCAHGLRYGVPRFIVSAVQEGSLAVVNVSRAILGELDASFPRVRVVRVTVPESVREARILTRGRETSAAALARLNRPDPAPGRPVDLEIVNDGSLADAGAALISFVQDVLVHQRA